MEIDENRWESVVVIVVVEERSRGWEPAELAWLGLGADSVSSFGAPRDHSFALYYLPNSHKQVRDMRTLVVLCFQTVSTNRPSR